MEKLLIAALWALTVLGGGFVGFMTAYLKKKGENLATHEDIAKLVEQVRAVTTATKQIEAKISSDVWDRQRRWELKRDVLFEATKRLGALEAALRDLEITFLTARKGPLDDAGWVNFKVEANKKWFDEKRRFEEACLLMDITCSKEAKDACDSIRAFMAQIAAKINKDDPEIYTKSQKDLIDKFRNVTTAIRKELEADKTT